MIKPRVDWNKDDVEFSEEGSFTYGNKQESLKEIVLRHIKKISDITTQELTAGYWQKRPVKTGGGVMIIEEYKPDLREAYCNAVDFLSDIVYPDSDLDFKEYIQQYNSNEKEAFKKAKEDGLTPEQWVKKRVKMHRELLKEIFIMFERFDYFSGEEEYTE